MIFSYKQCQRCCSKKSLWSFLRLIIHPNSLLYRSLFTRSPLPFVCSPCFSTSSRSSQIFRYMLCNLDWQRSPHPIGSAWNCYLFEILLQHYSNSCKIVGVLVYPHHLRGGGYGLLAVWLSNHYFDCLRWIHNLGHLECFSRVQK